MKPCNRLARIVAMKDADKRANALRQFWQDQDRLNGTNYSCERLKSNSESTTVIEDDVPDDSVATTGNPPITEIKA